MTAIPKSQAAATRLLERYAEVDARLAAVEAQRTVEIGSANADADAEAGPLLKERDTIAASIESWWPAAAPHIANGKKSVELGGCIIGSKKSRARLIHSFANDDEAVEALRASRFANRTTKVKYSLDRAATFKLLEIGGKTGASIAAMGFSIDLGADHFFIERVQQDRTISG